MWINLKDFIILHTKHQKMKRWAPWKIWKHTFITYSFDHISHVLEQSLLIISHGNSASMETPHMIADLTLTSSQPLRSLAFDAQLFLMTVNSLGSSLRDSHSSIVNICFEQISWTSVVVTSTYSQYQSGFVPLASEVKFKAQTGECRQGPFPLKISKFPLLK